MKIKTEELLKILNTADRGLASKEIIEQATHYVFAGGDIMTYNDQICVVQELDVGEDCSVPAEEFHKIINKIKSKEVKLEVVEIDDGLEMQIKSSNIKASVNCLIDDTIPELVDMLEIDKAEKDMLDAPEDFATALKCCVFSTSGDMSNPALTCLNIDGEYVVACDGLQISRYKMEGEMEHFFLPGSSAQEIKEFDIEQYCIREEWAYFKDDEGTIICSRTMEVDAQDFTNEFDVSGTRVRLPTGLSTEVETAAIFATGEVDVDKRIKVTIEKGSIVCTGENKRGKIEAKLESDKLGKKKLVFWIHPKSLVDILKETSSMIHSDDVALFKSGGFEHLISLFIDSDKDD